MNFIRNSRVDLYRFAAALMIMFHHCYQAGVLPRDYPFYQAWIYVEFFFILTGYYTMKHFYEKKDLCCEGESRSRKALKYTIKKFKPYLVYTIPVTILHYIIDMACNYRIRGLLETVRELQDIFFELSFVIVINKYPKAATLWFLSAMFLIFPVYCIICQWNDKWNQIIFCFYMALLYHAGKFSALYEILPPEIFRGFSNVCLGGFCFLLGGILDEKRVFKNRMMVTVLELLCFVIPVAAVFYNAGWTEFILLCFSFGVILMHSDISIFSSIRSNTVTEALGKLSLPVFVWQWLTASQTQVLFGRRSDKLKAVIYIFSTLTVSVIHFLIVETVKKNRNRL